MIVVDPAKDAEISELTRERDLLKQQIEELQALLTEYCYNEPEAKTLVADAKAAEIAVLRGAVKQARPLIQTERDRTSSPSFRSLVQSVLDVIDAALEMSGGVK